MSPNINCRFATLNDDIKKIAQYIYQTDIYIYPSIVDNYESDAWIELISNCYTDPNNIFYYKNILVLEIDGIIYGILCAIRGGQKYSFSENIIYSKEIIEEINTVENGYFKPLFDENYSIKGINIINLCIETDLRHKGLGQQLLTYCIKQYPNEIFVLDVVKNNIPGVNLYLKNGFKIEKEYEGFSGKGKFITCLKMVKD